MFNRELFDAALAAYLATHKLSLREAARSSGVSASTLSRLVNGEAPDIENFGRLCLWMGQLPGAFFSRPEVTSAEWLAQSSYPQPLALAIYALLGDTQLPLEGKKKLVELVKVAYACLCQSVSSNEGRGNERTTRALSD